MAHLSFFERWDSTSLSRLGFVHSADATKSCISVGTSEDEKEARRCMSPRLPTFAKTKAQRWATRLNLLRDCQKLLFLFGFRRRVERTGLLPQGVHQCIENGLQGLRAIAKYAFHALAIDGELANLTHSGHIKITAC